MGRKINCVLGTRGGVVLPEGRRQKAPLGCFFFFPTCLLREHMYARLPVRCVCFPGCQGKERRSEVAG